MEAFHAPVDHGAVPTRNERKEKYMAKTRAEAGYLFKYLIITQMVVYLEAGAIPCLLDQLSVSLNMNATQQGALGGVVYFSLSTASPLCAYFLHRFNPKHVLGLSLIANNLAVLVLALTPTGYSFSANMMIFARALIGFTQAFPCIYTPLWVDEYAPREKVAGWMSYLQGSVPMGVMLGYFVGTVSNWIVPDTFTLFECWRWPFVLQFVAMCPIMIAIFFVPEKHLIIRSDDGGSAITSATSSSTPQVDKQLEVEEDANAHLETLTEENTRASDATTEGDKIASPAPVSALLKSEGAASELEPLQPAQLRSTSSAEYSGIFGFFEDVLSHNPPLSRSSFRERHEEEDAMLASATMFGVSSQRGLRQLHQNHQQHHLDQHDSSSSSFSSFRRNSTRNSSFLDGAPSDMENATPADDRQGFASSPMRSKASPQRNGPISTGSAASYGTLDHHAPLRSPMGLMEASILEEEFIEAYEQGSFSDGIRELLRIPIFGLIVFGLTAVYFVVTGVQYWSTIFMIKSLHASKYLVNSLFVFVAGTGPIFGVFYGGWLIDRYGGYIGAEQRARSLGICMVLGVTAFVIAAFTTFFNDIWLTAVCLWLLLFFGGSILPACTGIFISVVPAQHRALASSVSVMIFNLLGYSLSPYLTGLVMEWVLSHQGAPGSYFEFCDEACAYRIGFRFCLFWSVWSFVCISSAWIIAKREAAAARETLQHFMPKHLDA
ncbi:TPA: hypothetical protein N0F65_009196 [Lagenidium giganteum]|uniref:Major facilitator superfamily (MFS) profile domain-containing protein n=1 Tax=Lagenidium giganteum TaxID=4803 RepID=A0AAV2YPA2_9STRA|nr:TPA: hypothetical protein N0F65_009196 [Lagenidium giganteum]